MFATLDTTVRKIAIKNVPFLLADTVGFIRKLPHHLVESFKSTLDEVREADVILHVVDISHPQFEDQMKVVNATLAELIKEPKPTIIIFNKIDAFHYVQKEEDDLTPVTRENYSLNDLKQMWMSRQGSETVYISAVKKENIEELKEKLFTISSKRSIRHDSPIMTFFYTRIIPKTIRKQRSRFLYYLLILRQHLNENVLILTNT